MICFRNFIVMADILILGLNKCEPTPVYPVQLCEIGKENYQDCPTSLFLPSIWINIDYLIIHRICIFLGVRKTRRRGIGEDSPLGGYGYGLEVGRWRLLTLTWTLIQWEGGFQPGGGSHIFLTQPRDNLHNRPPSKDLGFPYVSEEKIL